MAQTQWQGQHCITLLVPVNDVTANPGAVLHLSICQDEDPSKLIPYYRLKASKETRLALSERAGDWAYPSKRKDSKGNLIRPRAVVVEVPY